MKLTVYLFCILIPAASDIKHYIKENFLDFVVFCFTETHLTNDVTNEYVELEGFLPPYRKDNTAHKGGLLIYVSDKFVAKRRIDLEDRNVNAIWVEIKYKESSVFLSNVYRSPNTPVVFWQDFNVALENALNASNNLIIVGDINEDQLNVNNHHLKNI